MSHKQRVQKKSQEHSGDSQTAKQYLTNNDREYETHTPVQCRQLQTHSTASAAAVAAAAATTAVAGHAEQGRTFPLAPVFLPCVCCLAVVRTSVVGAVRRAYVTQLKRPCCGRIVMCICQLLSASGAKIQPAWASRSGHIPRSILAWCTS